MSSLSMDMNMTNLSKNVALALSFYSPVIISTSMLIFSIFSGALGKGLFFIFWLLVVTAVRIFILWIIPSNTAAVSQNKNPICAMGSFLPYDNGTYSTFILCFSFLYHSISFPQPASPFSLWRSPPFGDSGQPPQLQHHPPYDHIQLGGPPFMPATCF